MKYSFLSNQPPTLPQMFVAISYWSGSSSLVSGIPPSLKLLPGLAVAPSHGDIAAIVPQYQSLYPLQQVKDGKGSDPGW